MRRHLIGALLALALGVGTLSWMAASAPQKEKGQLYLVTVEFVDPGPMMPASAMENLVEKVVIPSFEQLGHYKEEGVVLADGLPLAGRQYIAIMEAPSHQALSERLRQLPWWGVMRHEVVPLDRTGDRLKADRQFLEWIQSQSAAK
ncbi:MAG: hypothetical protein KatS3mg115_2426 [Candidatus Poribacteria bacterium]|nr:MAG: hypothetical protein KatS3mg115_2426 [Candidatus Poribacteria bacterium]